jgi:D-tyrosyl-tRNA(Tyr) deacylase
MRAVIQRVKHASVDVNGIKTGTISKGIVTFLGIHRSDDRQEITWMADKIINLRIFPDPDGKMNISLADINAEMLIVSQFTLYGDCRKGRRPGYSGAAPPEIAEPIYNRFVDEVRKKGIKAATGRFQAMMDVTLVNDGPVTLLLDSEKKF